MSDDAVMMFEFDQSEPFVPLISYEAGASCTPNNSYNEVSDEEEMDDVEPVLGKRAQEHGRCTIEVVPMRTEEMVRRFTMSRRL